MADPAITAAQAPRESDFSPRKIRISLVVLLGTLFGSSILPMMAISLLLVPMTEEFGWSRTEYSGGMAAMMWAGALSAPLIGRYVDRVGVRPTIIGGTIAVGLLVMLMSLQDGSLLQFYGSFGLLGIIGSTALGYSKVIGALFTEHRGKALAIFGVESSLAGATAPLLVMWLISNYGWRGMFVGLGLIILAVVPILYFYLDEPDTPVHPATGGPAHVLPGLVTRDVVRTRTFWLITIASLIAIGPAMGLMPHYVPYLMSRGFDGAYAAVIISASTIAMAVGTVAGGWVLDHAKSAKIAAPFSVLSTLGILMLMAASSTFGGVALLVAASSLVGFAGGAKRPMGTYFHMRFFGLRSFAEVTGLQGAFMAAGMGLAPIAVGYSYDRLGTYQPAFIAMVAGLAITVVLYLLLGPYRYSKDFADAPFEPEELEKSGIKAEGVTVSTAISG